MSHAAKDTKDSHEKDTHATKDSHVKDAKALAPVKFLSALWPTNIAPIPPRPEMTEEELKVYMYNRRVHSIRISPEHGIAVGALPRSYENVKEVRELFGVLFKQELTVDVDGFIRESDLHDLPSGTTKDTIDRTSLLAGIEKFARYGPSGPIEWLEDVGTDELADPYISNPCKMAIVNVSIEVIMVVLGALGMPSAAKVAKKVMNGIPVSRLVGLELSIQALKTAQTVAHKAHAVIDVMMGIFSLTGINTFLAAFRSSLRWWDYLIMGIWIGIQLLAWFASAGLSVWATLLGMGVALGTTAKAAYDAVQACR